MNLHVRQQDLTEESPKHRKRGSKSFRCNNNNNNTKGLKICQPCRTGLSHVQKHRLTWHSEQNIGLRLLPSGVIWEQYQNSSHALNSTFESLLTAPAVQKWTFFLFWTKQRGFHTRLYFSVWSWDTRTTSVCSRHNHLWKISLLADVHPAQVPFKTTLSHHRVCLPRHCRPFWIRS